MTTNLIKYSVNRPRILTNIALNTGVNNLSEASNLRKLAEPILDEFELLGEELNRVSQEFYIDTASLATLQRMGYENNLYRNIYRVVDVTKDSAAITMSVRLEDVIDGIGTQTIPFRKGETVNLDNFYLTFKEDVIFNSPTDIVSIAATLKPIYATAEFIRVGSTYTVTPQNTSVAKSYELSFNMSVGIAELEESVLNFRERLKKASVFKTSDFKSILNLVIEEIPNISYLETDSNINDSVEVIYPYTEDLVINGADSNITSYIIPLLYQQIDNKVSSSMVYEVTAPVPINLSVNFKSQTPLTFQNLLVKLRLNEAITTLKGAVAYDTLVNLILGVLQEYSPQISKDSITLSFNSIETFEASLLNSTSTIGIPVGRFLYITQLVGA